jgi:D-alanyl-lipoteichoic acid acyltransferase DltB (MBOAT superfamily)
VSLTSAPFFAFLAAVFAAYWLAARFERPRLAVLLFANCLFCSRFGLFYVVLLPACGLLDYLVGLGLTRFRNSFLRRLLLGVSLAANLGLMAVSRHAAPMLRHDGWDWVFPLGLSFYCFQALSYTIDLYRGAGEAAPNLLSHLTAASFFPTLLAGPITRVREMAQQFHAPAQLTREDGGRALFLIAFGLLKKLLIADYLAETLVNRVFDTPTLYSGFEVLVAVWAYSFQLYYDFSGYTDIARGAGLLLGVRLPPNFDRPYLSQNVSEFWRRWHMSFSFWLRDYLYFSLPGKRSKFWQTANLAITMALGGLWHGLGWTFAVWGLLHGVALALERVWQMRRGRRRGPSRWRPLAIFATWQFVCFTWIFFRAGSMADAWAILGRIGSLTGSLANLTPMFAAVLALAAAGHFLARWYAPAVDWFARTPFYVHAAALTAVAIALQLLGGRGAAPFVYTRF